MNLKWSHLIVGLFLSVNALPNEEEQEQIEAFINLSGFGYEDRCFNVSQSQWEFIRNPSKETLQSWESALMQYGSYKQEERNNTLGITNDTNSHEATLSSLLEYKYQLVTKPGDALLPSTDWQKFISFIGQVEFLHLTGNYSSSDKLSREDVENLLARSGSPENKLKSWNSWYNTLTPLTTKFAHNLQLVQKAARANGAENATKYWEMLAEYENGYEKAGKKWNEISELHKKIIKFVESRLARKYGDSIKKNHLPAHLLGSLQAYDWTPLAMDVILDYDIVYELRKNLWAKGLVGENLYKAASRLGNITLKHVPEAQFFDESDFQSKCPTQLVNFCKGIVKISSCSNASISNYLSAHKNIAKILIQQMSEESSTILNIANRYSGVDEGIAELFGIFASSGAWLHSLDLINETEDNEQVQMVSLMITALDVLPRMAYYLSADMWRLEALGSNNFDPNILTTSWWKYRLQYEGISNSAAVPTFLDDKFITSNRPYLPNFLGTLLGFQIYEYLMESTEVKMEKIDADMKHSSRSQLIKLIQYGTTENWHDAIREYLEIYDISTNSLLRYFSPLEQYLEDNEEETVPIPSQREKELEQLEDEYKKKFFTPTTTARTSTASTSITTPAPKTQVKKASEENLPSADNSVKSQKIETPPTSKNNANLQADAPKNILQPATHDVGDDTKLVKSGTHKAVYAVGAVLIGTIVIVIIAIFGRRRCRKTPKNRRYV